MVVDCIVGWVVKVVIIDSVVVGGFDAGLGLKISTLLIIGWAGTESLAILDSFCKKLIIIL